VEHVRAAELALEYKRKGSRATADLAYGMHRYIKRQAEHARALAIGLRRALEWTVAQEHKRKELRRKAREVARRTAADVKERRRKAREALVPTRRATEREARLTYQPFAMSMEIRLHPVNYNGLVAICDRQSRERYESSPVVKQRRQLERHMERRGFTPAQWSLLANGWRNTSSVPTDDALNRPTVSIETYYDDQERTTARESSEVDFWLRAGLQVAC
jgi:hypothetical protein